MEQPSRRGLNPVAGITGATLLLIAGYALANNTLHNTLSPLIKDFGLIGARQGLMGGMISLGGAVALVLTPMLQSRVRKATLLAAGAVLQVLMLGLSGAAPSFEVLLAACALLGLGGGWIDSSANSLFVDLHGKNSPKYLGMLHGCFGIGGLLTPLLIGAVLTAYPWRTAYVVGAGISGVVALVFIVAASAFGRKLRAAEIAPELPVTAASLRVYLRGRRTVLLLAAGVLYAASQQGFAGWVIRYMEVRFHENMLGPTALSLFWVTSTVSRFFAPRIKARPLAVFSLGSLLAAAALVLGVLFCSAPAMCAAAAVIGLVSGHCMPMLMGEAASGHPGGTSLPTSAMLFFMMFSRMGMPLLMGGVSSGSIATAMCLPALASAGAAAFGSLALRKDML